MSLPAQFTAGYIYLLHSCSWISSGSSRGGCLSPLVSDNTSGKCFSGVLSQSSIPFMLTTSHSTHTVMTEDILLLLGKCPTSELKSVFQLLNCFHNPLNIPSKSLFHCRTLLHLISIPTFLYYESVNFSVAINFSNYLWIHQVAKMTWNRNRWCLNLLQHLFSVALHLNCTVQWMDLFTSAKNFRMKEVSACNGA